MWSFGLENGYVVFMTTTGKTFTSSSRIFLVIDFYR